MLLRPRIPWILAAVLIGLGGPSPAPAQNLLTNPGFYGGMNGWEFLLKGSALAFPDSTSGALCTFFVDDGSGEGDILLLQRLVPLDHDASYRLRFSASADAGRPIGVHVGNREAPFVTYGSSTANVTQAPQIFETVFSMSAASDRCAIVAFRLGGHGTAGVCIDNVQLEETSAPPPTPPTPPPTVPPAAPQPLRTMASALGLRVGAAVRDEALFCEDDYAEVLTREYNLLSPEHALLMSSLRPEVGTYAFATPDAMVAYAAQKSMAVRGHTLVWHEALPTWIEYGQLPPATLAAVLQDHVQTVVSHYAGQIAAWNVVNEAIDYDGSMRDTLWLQALGPSYIDQAFEWAHAADPAAVLIYNDFNHEGLDAKSDGVFDLVQGLVQRGVPIDGVGFQAHFGLGFPRPPRAEIEANMDRYAAIGIDVYITEMDVAIAGIPSAQDLEDQAAIYQELMSICLEKPNCRELTTHGFTDKHTWVDELMPGYGSPLPFDANYFPKPAYFALSYELARNLPPVPALPFWGSLALAVLMLFAALARLSRRQARSSTAAGAGTASS